MNNKLVALKGLIRELLKKWRPPRRIFPTRAGWVALGAPFVLGMAAINAGNNLLFLLLGAALGAIVISGIMSERALSGIRVELQALGPARAGERSRFGLQIRRELFEPGDNPAFGLMVREQRTWAERKQSEGLLFAIFPRIEGAQGKVIASRVFEKRGLAKIRPLELRTIYPFGLLTKSKDIPLERKLIIWPRVVPVPGVLEQPAGRSRQEGHSQGRGLGTELYGLRERTERDSLNRVHARRSLALGREVVIETEEQERPQAWIGVVSNSQSSLDAFERVIEIACQTMARWSELGFRVGLCVGEKKYSPDIHGLRALIDVLALLQPASEQALPENLFPGALWLIPEGFGSLPDSHQSCVVDPSGEVALC